MHDVAVHVTTTNADITNKPRAWLVVLLAVLSPALAFLYIGKGKWGGLYFIINLLFLYFLKLHPFMPFAVLLLHLLGLIAACIMAHKAVTYNWYRLHVFLKILAGLYLLAVMTRLLWFNVYHISSVSMYPTIHQGGYLIAKRWGLGYFNPLLGRQFDIQQLTRGEVILFAYPLKPSHVYIKRVIGLPGDKIAFDKGTLLLNGKKQILRVQPQSSPYIAYYDEQIGSQPYTIVRMLDQDFSASYQFMKSCPVINQLNVCTVPAGQVFVLGDNRDQSADSRFWGYVPVQNIIGRVIWVNNP